MEDWMMIDAIDKNIKCLIKLIVRQMSYSINYCHHDKIVLSDCGSNI